MNTSVNIYVNPARCEWKLVRILAFEGGEDLSDGPDLKAKVFEILLDEPTRNVPTARSPCARDP